MRSSFLPDFSGWCREEFNEMDNDLEAEDFHSEPTRGAQPDDLADFFVGSGDYDFDADAEWHRDYIDSDACLR